MRRQMLHAVPKGPGHWELHLRWIVSAGLSEVLSVPAPAAECSSVPAADTRWDDQGSQPVAADTDEAVPLAASDHAL